MHIHTEICIDVHIHSQEERHECSTRAYNCFVPTKTGNKPKVAPNLDHR